ncbi:MAG: type IV pilus secretin PilQ [Sutterellaceae bacterium]|nr:type IV pilus secretin PilQ [Burkholderiaceae bacterium]MCX7901394.1 type IV pilus secretin PilQ [Burkholderiaceae bacterium]MDW8430114.1 type IV pilus secretin PilQ [Sutterellaceae bacterium]
MTDNRTTIVAAKQGAGAFLLALLMPAIVWAQGAVNSIERIDATQTGTSVVLTIQLKAPFSGIPASFSVANPARIAIDLPQTVNNLGRNVVEINQGDLRSVNVVQAQGRSRLVLNLRRAVAHAITVEGSTIQVALGATGDTTTFRPTEAPTPSGAVATAASAVPAVRTLRAIDFRRGPDGEGRVVVDLSDPNTSVDIRQQGNQVIVDFLNTALPEALRRRLDVTDFGTPVAMVNAFAQGANTRLVIEPRGLWEHNAYQSDTRFVVEVKPIKEDPTRLFQGTRQGYQGERLSLNFQNVDVRSLLQVIADFTNLNIITSDSVTGSITLRLKDVPWDQALDIILQSKGLDMRKNGNVIIVAPREELAAKEKLELEARNQIADLEPLRTESFVVNYQKAEDVRKLLVDEKQRLLSKRGSVVVDQRTNQLFVQDTAARLEEVRRLLQRIDIPVPQVMIEARIVEADDRFSQNLGARFGFARVTSNQWLNAGPGSSFGPGTVGGSSGNIGNTTTVSGPNVSVTNPNFVNLPAAGIGGFPASTIGLTLFNSSVTRLLNLELSALEADGRGKIISSPRVITADKVKALIEQGTEIPYQAATSSGATQIQFRKAVLKLEVTPQITPEGAIFLDVKVNRDSPSAIATGGAGVAIDTKAVQTQVLVENGGTVVLGGIYEQRERTTITKVPLLGDVPVLGWLFRNRGRIDERTELMIFITPRIVSERVAAAGR